MAVLDLIDYGGELSAQFFIQADTEDLADAIGRKPPQADLAASFEDLVNRKVALEDEVSAVFDLRDRIKAR